MRFSASAMAMLPSLVAGTAPNTPLKLPIGVRTALTMTTCCFLFTGCVSVTPFTITPKSLPFTVRPAPRPRHQSCASVTQVSEGDVRHREPSLEDLWELMLRASPSFLK